MPTFFASGDFGGTDSLTLNPGTAVSTQFISVKVKPGKSLILKNVKFCTNDDGDTGNARLKVSTTAAEFFSNTSCGDETPNVTLFTNGGTSTTLVKITIGLFNASDPSGPDPTPINILPFDGWSLRFKVTTL